MTEVFALEVDFRAAEFRAQIGGEVKRRRTADVLARQTLELGSIKADFILIDTFHPQLFGGTGQTRRLDALRALDLSRVFVSGGLAPENAAEAAAFNPYALDVASGVESAPGIKDGGKLRSFIANASPIKPGSTSTHAKLSR
jgi:phosphoribosylanthranilate isomerase